MAGPWDRVDEIVAGKASDKPPWERVDEIAAAKAKPAGPVDRGAPYSARKEAVARLTGGGSSNLIEREVKAVSDWLGFGSKSALETEVERSERSGEAFEQGRGLKGMLEASGGTEASPFAMGMGMSGPSIPIARAAGKGVGSALVLDDLAQKRAVEIVKGRLEQDLKGTNTTANDVLFEAGKTPDKPLTLADMSDANVIGLLGKISRRPGEAGAMVKKFLEDRDKLAGTRATEDINLSLGGKSTYKAADDLIEGRAKAVAPLYEEAFKKNQNVASPLLDRILETDAGKSALAGARSRISNKMQLMGKPDPELMEQARETGQRIEGGKGVASGLKLKTWDLIKQELDDMIGATKRKVISGTARKSEVADLVDLKNKLVGQLDALDVTARPARKGRGYGAADIPARAGAYSRARAEYSGPSRSLDALEEGRDIFKKEPEEIAQEVGKLSSGDREFYRLGAAQEARKMIAKTGQAGDEARKLVGNEWVKAQLRPLFDNEAEYNQLVNNLTAESRMFKKKFETLGGSQTAGRVAEDMPGLEALTEAGHAALSASHGNTLGAITRGYRSFNAWRRTLDPATNMEVAKILTTPLNAPGSPGLKLLTESGLNPARRNALNQIMPP